MSMIEKIEKTPLIKQVYKHLCRKRFKTNGYGCFWGVFETFEQAKQAAPKTKPIGYDNEKLAQEYQQMLEQNNWEGSGWSVRSHDYPVLFWLRSIFEEGCTQIFDFGGNVGIHYYTYSKYLEYPDIIQWTICDLPSIISAGKHLAEQRFVKNLNFTSNFDEIQGKDVFIASGSVQYVENLASMLSCVEKPKHLLINRLPLYEGKQFVTLQNGGQVFYPQYVFNKNDFIEGLQQLGYKLIDIWQGNDSCRIPFHPDRSVRFYHGLYLKLRG